nr:alpha-L-rhamnosidase [uncultured Arsenicibacter sp.]
MKKTALFSFLFYLIHTVVWAQTGVQHLRCENLSNPLGLDVVQPRFSWQLISPRRNVLQTAYEIRVSTDEKTLAKGAVWNTGKVVSDSSVHVAYAGKPLQSGERYYWQVRVYDNTGQASAWSTPAWFQMALLKETDWKASWIGPGYVEDSTLRPSPMFRKEFTARKPIRKATAYMTAHGMYLAQLNGERVGDAFLTPGWTAYGKRLQYQVYDVTKLLKQGPNAIGVTLGSGWYRGFIGFSNQKNYFGKDVALLCQLEITYSDGTTERIVSDNSWKSTSAGPIRSSEIYNGEIYDARMEKDGWNRTGYKDIDWSGVRVHDYAKNHLVATYNEPVRKRETFQPVKIMRTPNGEQVVDFGQNLVGWVVVRATGKAGDTITLSHAEVLDKKGNFYTENLRAAVCQNKYVLKGKPAADGFEKFEPHFTWQGFRYIKVEGMSDLKPENFLAVVLYSDMNLTGQFSSSNPLINQLQKNIQWGQRGNFLDVPTDCPQRDERLGWTGDAQAFSRTAAFNFGVENFFAKWLKDVAADQLPNGSVPFVVPNVLGKGAVGSTGWADVATIAPWNMYLAYGDKRILEQQYLSMKAWVGYMQKESKKDAAGSPVWASGFHFGDWLFYRPFDDNDGRAAVTDKYLIAQCFFAHSTQLLINTAKVLGKTDDVQTYSRLLQAVKDAFRREYMTPNGRLVSSTQTAYVLALNFDMLPEDLRASTAQRLVDNVKSYGNHLTTGFLGTPYLCHVLSRFGHDDVAYALLMQESYPSWLYPVKMGATTIWERWDGIKPDSTFQTPSMNSYNHYAYGAIGDWMYRVVAGLDTEDDGPGYHKIRIQPHIGGKLTAAKADLQTPYGLAGSGWKIENGKLTLDIDIPANTTAKVYIPATGVDAVQEGGKPVSAAEGVKPIGQEKGYVILQVGSGKYQFTANR